MKPCCCCCSKNINNPENKEPSKLDSEIPETVEEVNVSIPFYGTSDAIKQNPKESEQAQNQVQSNTMQIPVPVQGQNVVQPSVVQQQPIQQTLPQPQAEVQDNTIHFTQATGPVLNNNLNNETTNEPIVRENNTTQQ